MSDSLVAIVGGGITGLAAAWELHCAGVPFELFEASPRFGGLIRTERVGPYLIDTGADGFVVHKPGARELCRELGLDAQLIRPLAETAFVLRNGTLHPLPDSGTFGLPTGWRDLWRADLFSVRGRLRLALGLLGWGRPSPTQSDESIADFFRRRFGEEVATYLGEPLLAGIHAGDPERLSMRALFPRLLEMDARHGGLLRGFREGDSEPARRVSPFRSFVGGLSVLVDALVARLPGSALHPGVRVRTLTGGPPYRLDLATGDTVTTDAVILAVPPHSAAQLLSSLDPTLAGFLRAVRHSSSVTVVLAYPRGAVEHPLHGVGFVVPRAEARYRLLAATWISSKWPGRAPADHVLLRGFFGGERDPHAIEATDEALVARAHEELASLLRIEGSPLFKQVFRWPRANPQLEIGHLDRLAAFERELRRWPGLFLAGAGYRGVGIADCIADGRAAARQAARI